MKVGIIQQTCSADIENNKYKLACNIRTAAQQGAQLVVLQELHNSLYFCQTEDVSFCNLAEPIPGPSTQFYGALAAELGIVLVTSLYERRAPGLYHNTAVVFEADGSIAGTYRKMHIPDDPAYYEKFYFTPGDLGFNPIQTSIGLLGVWTTRYRSQSHRLRDRSKRTNQRYTVLGKQFRCRTTRRDTVPGPDRQGRNSNN